MCSSAVLKHFSPNGCIFFELHSAPPIGGLLQTDVLVVGAGPTGCFAAKSIAERGFRVTIVEEHAEVGQPVQCAGVVGVSGMRELDLRLDDLVLTELKRAIFHPPSGEPIELSRGRVEALVINRGAFDRELAEMAIETGATLFTQTKCSDLSLGKDGVRVELEGKHAGELRARLVIGADGPTSMVARKAGLMGKRTYVRCAQVEARSDVDPNTVELYFGRVAPGFFAWLVPAGERCRIGLGTTENPKRKLSIFLDRLKSERSVGRATHPFVDLIPALPPGKISSDRVLLVGDAACQVKPLTGGGLYTGLACTRIAAEVAVEALKTEPTTENLRTYEREVKKKFGLEFELGMRARRLFQKLSDEELTSALGLLKKPRIRSLVLKHADFDHHGELFKTLIKQAPVLLPSIGLRGLIKCVRRLA